MPTTLIESVGNIIHYSSIGQRVVNGIELLTPVLWILNLRLYGISTLGKCQRPFKIKGVCLEDENIVLSGFVYVRINSFKFL